MQRRLVILSLAGVLGLLLTAADARACHKRKAACECPPVPACPTVVVEYVPVPVPPPVPCPPEPCAPAPAKAKHAKKGCGSCGERHGLLARNRCHQKAVAPAPCVVPTPVVASLPAFHAPILIHGPAPQGVFPAGQSAPAPQGAPFAAPAKAMPQG